MPPGFAYPNRAVEFWTPMRLSEEDFADRTNLCLHVVARLKRGVSLEAASAEMRGIAAAARERVSEGERADGSERRVS